MIISQLPHYIFKLLCGIQAWAPSPSDNSPRAGRLGINEVAATTGGGGSQIKPLVGGGCWRIWQSGTQQTEGITSICVSRLEGYSHGCRCFPYLLFLHQVLSWSPCLPSLQREVQEVTCRKWGCPCPLTVASCRARARKLRLLVSDLFSHWLMSHLM